MFLFITVNRLSKMTHHRPAGNGIPMRRYRLDQGCRRPFSDDTR